MIIGTFKAEGDGYTGQIDALGLAVIDITFRPIKDKKINGPDFIITGISELSDIEDLNVLMHAVIHGPTYDVGAAWKKTDETGKPYLAVKLDSPAFAAPIHCAPSPPIWVSPTTSPTCSGSMNKAMVWQPIPAPTSVPSGTLVDELCGQPEQKYGVRSVIARGVASARSLASITAIRAAIRARTSSGSSSLPIRLAIALATIAGENS